MSGLSKPEHITKLHDLAAFDCGEPVLNEWLRSQALPNEKSGASRTYVVTAVGRVVGYYCLSTGSIDRRLAPGRLGRNMPDPIPMILLGRLAVDRAFKGQGLGPALLQDAFLRVCEMADKIGVRGVLVHALNAKASDYYEDLGFHRVEQQPGTYWLLVSEVRVLL